ncbi:AbrB family transcriptional regulator [Tatumella sp. JGM118]|uniref:AbrB family transcriptional regulator n=1 Tax=Tatumella sp. JGM118 TaxID=2799796 RepID=UPI001BB06901|nr:AbrB family transcriptional regulator [Tatumella sp. JGM118]MBS0908540.1 AbrB family transcriptional regulator [Tatumella sp. JGM118]
MNRASSRIPGPLRWLLLVLCSAGAVIVLEYFHLPAALLLGPMFAAIIFAASGQPLALAPRWQRLAQAVVGSMIARAMPSGVFTEMQHHWPLFILSVFSVIIASTLLGGILAKLRVLPGSTALWGSSPGAATAMTLMAGDFGADTRLVAFMQYLRVLMVALLATLVSHFFTENSGQAIPVPVFFAPLDLHAFLLTLALIAGCTLLAGVIRLPAGPMLLSMFFACLLQNFFGFRIELPLWFLALAYTVIGWAIGFRFTRQILRYALHALPGVLVSVCTLLLICCGFAWLLVHYAGIDPLTAYLATSPGGADSVAIIASSSHVDQPFVMSMQTGRFIAVLILGPLMAKWMVRWV